MKYWFQGKIGLKVKIQNDQSKILCVWIRPSFCNGISTFLPQKIQIILCRPELNPCNNFIFHRNARQLVNSSFVGRFFISHFCSISKHQIWFRNQLNVAFINCGKFIIESDLVSPVDNWIGIYRTLSISMM